MNILQVTNILILLLQFIEGLLILNAISHHFTVILISN